MAIVIVEDLLFRSKIEAAAGALGAAVITAASAEQAKAEAASAPGSAVIVDLNHAGLDPLQLIRDLRQADPLARLTGFCSHVQTGLAAQAKEAGCDSVLPRSALVQQLPELLA